MVEFFPLKLIDNWLHPLSESFEINGDKYLNSWYTASAICGIATQRLEGCQNDSIEILIIQGIVDAEIFEETLIRCRENDAEYLQLLNATQEVLDKD